MILTATLLTALASLASIPAKPDDDHRLDWWQDARFGLFIHWGLYAVPAGEWGDQKGHGEWIRETAHIPVTEYEKLLTKFNPVKFDADKWVKMAKDAGMKYIVITSKHHDGFALFDSKTGDFNVMRTPFKRDIMKELSAACHKAGIKMCWYHSIMDWHHPDYLPRRSWEDRPADGADFNRYINFLHQQVSELLTNYGEIGVMWFDGEWERTWNHELGQPLYDLCRKLQPNVIVNNRVDVGRGGMAGMTEAGYAGDYGTPEQEIPATGVPNPWETCMTMNDHWGYNRNDFNYKSTREIIRMLSDIASKGGNYLLNIGPTAEGEFPPESVQRLKEIGAWMRVNGEAIYGTRASLFKVLPWGRCTTKTTGGNTRLYLHVFDWPANGKLVVPGLGSPPASARLLGGGPLKFSRGDTDLELALPAKAPNPDCSVVALEFAGDVTVYGTPEIHAESEEFVRALPVRIEVGKGLEARYTLDGSTPTATSPRYSGSLNVAKTCTVTARAFHNGKAVSGTTWLALRQVNPRPAVQPITVSPGIVCDTYKGDWDALPDFGKLSDAQSATTDAIGLGPGFKDEYVGKRFVGFVDVPEDDVYLFSVIADDGARLWVHDQLVVDNDGLHGPTDKRGTIALARGLHPITVGWFNKTGGAELNVKWSRVGGKLEAITGLKH